ncbi:hypothetical protein [Paraburkholderia domus]|uniref:hypothetical protein n=1 Tax=Paraburkholderia domus TaxID=2793075 RepID=UPI001914AB15|nr:hypothetical protein [Paraburkholderia domus]
MRENEVRRVIGTAIRCGDKVLDGRIVVGHRFAAIEAHRPVAIAQPGKFSAPLFLLVCVDAAWRGAGRPVSDWPVKTNGERYRTKHYRMSIP